MIITGSKIEMDSKHQYKSFESKKNMTVIERSDHAVQFDFENSTKGLYDQLQEHQTELEQERIEEQMREYKKSLEEAKKNQKSDLPKSKQELKIEIMHQILNMIDRIISGKGFASFLSQDNLENNNNSSNEAKSMEEIIYQYDDEATLPAGRWKKTVVNSFYFREEEHTAYTSTGLVKCADGREISFDVTLEMSRRFCQKYDSLVQRDIIVTDPLVINFNGCAPDISDMTFLFDLDSDGEAEEISSLGSGSGFLALDKNHDGRINNGSELFGTESGDGFADLSAYDEDGNGWIDEADAIYKDLVVWTKDENGDDKIISLKDADVGAIYLGSASTEFTYKGDSYDETDAILRSTGVYMKESGGVGTISHVDFAV